MCDVCERRVHTHVLWGRRAAGASLSLGSCIFCSLSFFDVVLTLFILCYFVVDLMVGKFGVSYEPIQAFPTRQGCTPESYELVATFISL